MKNRGKTVSAPMHYPVKASEDLRKGIAQSAVEIDTSIGSTGIAAIKKIRQRRNSTFTPY
jgi:hypothetical protein